MKVLLIHAGKERNDGTDAVLMQMQQILNESEIAGEIVYAGNDDLHGCISCMKCHKTKKCIYDGDLVNQILNALKEIDALVFAGPLLYGELTRQQVSLMDRLFTAAQDRLYGMPVVLVETGRAHASVPYDALQHYVSGSGMIEINGTGPLLVHGTTDEEVKQDHDGMRQVRITAHMLVWLLQSIEKGKQEGVIKPDLEPVEQKGYIVR